MNIFVGNLSFDATETDVKKLFEGFGNVASVVIVMSKEKKAPKSRGFSFVEMPDEQPALAAIAALNGKEFMGRVLNVNPARPKTEAQAESELKEKRQPKVTVEAEQHPREEREQKKTLNYPVFNKYPALTDRRVRPSGQYPALTDRRVRPSGQHLALKDGRVRPSGQHLALKDGRVRPFGQHLALKDRQVRPFGQPGTYKGGRRTHSYMKRRGLAGMPEEAKPWRKKQDNPMRWRKREDQPKPWQKSSGKHKPWKKAEEGVRPWKKAEGESKPWKKPAGDAKPWSKSESELKPWKKTHGGSKPWKKPAGESKPWSKSSERPQKSRFNPSTSLGMVRGNGERSRTKGRKIPGGYKR